MLFKSFAFNLNSAISFSPFAFSNIKSLSNLSAFALWSAILAAIFASLIASFPKFFNASVAPLILSAASLKLPLTSSTPCFNASKAPLTSPLNKAPKALPKALTVSITFFIGKPMTLNIDAPNDLSLDIAAPSPLNKSIINSPKSDNTSTTLPTTEPITPISLANLF